MPLLLITSLPHTGMTRARIHPGHHRAVFLDLITETGASHHHETPDIRVVTGHAVTTITGHPTPTASAPVTVIARATEGMTTAAQTTEGMTAAAPAAGTTTAAAPTTTEKTAASPETEDSANTAPVTEITTTAAHLTTATAPGTEIHQATEPVTVNNHFPVSQINTQKTQTTDVKGGQRCVRR